jgi:hypothetical protein
MFFGRTLRFALCGLVTAAVAVGCGAAKDDTETGQPAALSALVICTDDRQCNHGLEGTGLRCSHLGFIPGRCVEGCVTDKDCPGGSSCKSGACDGPLPKLGSPCTDDAFCNGIGKPLDSSGSANEDESKHQEPVGRICSTDSHQCIAGCRSDSDCPMGAFCNKFVGAPFCDGAVPQPPPPPPLEPCVPVTFPSGVSIATKRDAVLGSAYMAFATDDCPAPSCFISLDDLRTPDGQTLTPDVKLSEHFTLRELVQTEIDAKITSSMLLDPGFVEKLEAMRKSAAKGVTITSGFRSPLHQEAVCKSICGCASCVSDGGGGNRCGTTGTVTCARNSRHMWGTAADLGLEFSAAATGAGFPFVFQEFGGSGPHLHIDLKDCH